MRRHELEKWRIGPGKGRWQVLAPSPEAVRLFLMRTLWRRLREEPSPALCKRFAGYLHGMPPESLLPLIYARYGSILSMGMVESLALEAAGQRLLEDMRGD